MYSLLAVVLGFGIDLIVGDPHSIPHPVIFIGKLISTMEKLVRKSFPVSIWEIDRKISRTIHYMMICCNQFRSYCNTRT